MYNLFCAFATEALKWDTSLLPHVLADTRCLTQISDRTYLSGPQPNVVPGHEAGRALTGAFITCSVCLSLSSYDTVNHVTNATGDSQPLVMFSFASPTVFILLPCFKRVGDFQRPFKRVCLHYQQNISSVITRAMHTGESIRMSCLDGELGGGLGAAEMNDRWLGVQMEPVYAQNAMHIWAANSIKLSET